LDVTTLADYLNANQVSSEVVIQAAWNLASAEAGFPAGENIRDLFEKLPHPEEIEADIEALARDPKLMLAAALEVLSLAWEQERAIVISHIEEGQAALVSFPKLATVAGLLVVTGWLLLSKGVTHHETHTIIRPDGGYEQIETTDRGPFGLKIKASGGELELFVGSVSSDSPSTTPPEIKTDQGHSTARSGESAKSAAKPAIHAAAPSKKKPVARSKRQADEVCAPTIPRAAKKRGRPSPSS
jgi:hypothetical protein